MREFVFSLTFETGADELMDLFLDHPVARSEAFMCCLDAEQLWRLERVTGPAEAMDRIEALLLDSDRDVESISERRCEALRRHELLASGPNERVVYTYLDNIRRCDSVPSLATRYLPGGLLFEVARHGHEQHWRIATRDDERVGLLYDTLTGKLREGIDFEFGHLEDVKTPVADLLASPSLPYEQRETLELAAERGYYESPRETTLDELAAELDRPRSTVSYRLRRAEAALVDEYLSNTL